MRSKNRTVAECIAGLFGDDGQCFEFQGTSIEHISELSIGRVVRYERATKRIFSDGSSLVFYYQGSGSFWDLGMKEDCTCCDSTGHTEFCELGLGDGE